MEVYASVTWGIGLSGSCVAAMRLLSKYFDPLLTKVSKKMIYIVPISLKESGCMLYSLQFFYAVGWVAEKASDLIQLSPKVLCTRVNSGKES